MIYQWYTSNNRPRVPGMMGWACQARNAALSVPRDGIGVGCQRGLAEIAGRARLVIEVLVAVDPHHGGGITNLGLLAVGWNIARDPGRCADPRSGSARSRAPSRAPDYGPDEVCRPRHVARVRARATAAQSWLKTGAGVPVSPRAIHSARARKTARSALPLPRGLSGDAARSFVPTGSRPRIARSRRETCVAARCPVAD